ncbi:Wzz/FepE/Etk N-terminal domain-containing protein [Pseudomonas sp. 681]|jgi:LPS O-antigen subunit length determinant protein (WzzB/FepE family)|uniref:Wzz/FepE/Etk N-terminal domain-containing protein n=1 Tax=Pseudomonas fungipugnans TaxID=3024217 RepID=A0ABT6QKF8_9PSED|nr:Wzz/FepE/Etk N-terminal domain-containing protein [Pseudomonas sp. 681]MDI2591261.1 Wzz/FepE/Etk N-terminal domain-containing protein [Pseudomonas sp. 681]
MNFPAKIHRDSEHLEIDIAESLRLLWKQRGIVLLFSALSTAVAVTYVLLAQPQYKVQSYIRPVASASLDTLNESGLYKLKPEDALRRVGSSMESYDVRLTFFKLNPELLAPLQVPGQTLEELFEKFNSKAFTIDAIDPKKTANLSEAIQLGVEYPAGVDGVAIANKFTDFVVKREKEKVESDLKTLIANRTEDIERKLISKKAAYDAEKDSKIAELLEKDQLKKETLQDELKALRQQLQSRRQNRIKQLDEAITIAKKLGIVTPTTPSALGDSNETRQGNMIRTEVSNQQIPLYFMGQSALEAERGTLVSRNSDDFTEPRVDEIQKELSLLTNNRQVALLRQRSNEELFLKGLGEIREELAHLKSLHIDFDQFNLVDIDKIASPPEAPIKPKKALIVGIGLMLGLLLGLMVAMVRGITLLKEQKNEA